MTQKQEVAERIAQAIRALKPGQQYKLQDIATRVGTSVSTVERALQQHNRHLRASDREFRIPVSSVRGTFTLPERVRIGDLQNYQTTREATGVREQRRVGFKYARHSGTGDRR